MAKRKPTAESKEDALLARIRRRFDLATDGWRDIRDEGAEDMRYVAGDPWTSTERQEREAAGRPCLHLDELGQHFNQVINDVRANPRAVKFSPTGNGANDKAAEHYQNKMREIEYRSNAQIAYTTAFENAVQRSYGWVRVVTKYADDNTFDQDIWIEDIPNPDMVLPDPEAKRPDSSDMRYCFVFETWPEEEAKAAGFLEDEKDALSALRELAPSFVKGEDTVVITEYWEIEAAKRTLLLVETPKGQQQAVFEDELRGLSEAARASLKVLRRRDVESPKVTQYLTNGTAILRETPWPGKHIPIVSCFGKVIYVDEGAGAKRQILSMTRLARDPQKLYDYYRTTEAELVGMTPKTPFVGYVGQFAGREDTWQKVAHEPVAYLEANATTEATGQQVLPLPQRQPYDPPIQALEIGAESARRAIQSAMGSSPLPTQAQRRNEKSGIALRQIEDSSQRGSFHFVDHYDDMIRRVGVIVENLLDKVFDTPRETGVRTPDDTAEIVKVNDPNDPESSLKGDYLVTISTGPAYESQRQQGTEFANSLLQNPQLFPIIGPQAVKLLNLGAIGDQIVKALEAIQPPEVRAAVNGDKPDAGMLQQQLSAAMQQNEQLAAELQKRVDQLETEAVKGERDAVIAQTKEQAETQRELARIQADKEKAALDNLVKLIVAEINAETAEARAHNEMAQKALGFGHEHAENEAGRQHEAGEADKDRQTQERSADAQRAFEAEQAERAAQRDAQAGEGA
jgi:hypothetical protein